tara:strand:+ start:1097 stop:1783 length:687 start_codon:yes stop_codon:yes gene_type:complete
MTRNQVVFLDNIYKTHRDFEQYVKKLIYEEIGVCLDVKNTYPDKYKILIQLLERHPEFNSKSKNMCNIKIINDVLNVKALKTIIIKNHGEIDISWRCAITGKHKPFKYELMSAMRSSIDEQIYDFKINYKNNSCELCDSVKEIQVDHNDTKNSAFDELVYKFVKENNNIKIPDNFGELNDGTHRRCFLEKNYIFRDKWVEYHRRNAILRMLCHKCNISRPKTKIKLVL